MGALVCFAFTDSYKASYLKFKNPRAISLLNTQTCAVGSVQQNWFCFLFVLKQCPYSGLLCAYMCIKLFPLFVLIKCSAIFKLETTSCLASRVTQRSKMAFPPKGP